MSRASAGDSLRPADSDIHPPFIWTIVWPGAGATATAMFLTRREFGGRREGGWMLPDMRAIFAAFVAAIGLLMIAFAATAAFRVAQESRSVSFQADLAQRGQIVPPQSGQRVAVIETPGPHLAPPPPLPIVEVRTAPVGAEVSSILLVREAQPDPPPIAVAVAAPREQEAPGRQETPLAQEVEAPIVNPVGGPLAQPAAAPSEADRAAARAQRARKLAAARKARETRIARQRKAAAVRRAAQARARQQQAQPAQSFNTGFGNSGFGGGFRNQSDSFRNQ